MTHSFAEPRRHYRIVSEAEPTTSYWDTGDKRAPPWA